MSGYVSDATENPLISTNLFLLFSSFIITYSDGWIEMIISET